MPFGSGILDGSQVHNFARDNQTVAIMGPSHLRSPADTGVLSHPALYLLLITYFSYLICLGFTGPRNKGTPCRA